MTYLTCDLHSALTQN